MTPNWDFRNRSLSFLYIPCLLTLCIDCPGCLYSLTTTCVSKSPRGGLLTRGVTSCDAAAPHTLTGRLRSSATVAEPQWSASETTAPECWLIYCWSIDHPSDIPGSTGCQLRLSTPGSPPLCCLTPRNCLSTCNMCVRRSDLAPVWEVIVNVGAQTLDTKRALGRCICVLPSLAPPPSRILPAEGFSAIV